MGSDNVLIIENLIQAVKRNPILYDMNLPDYKNAFQKKLVWKSIAKEVGGKSGEAMCWKWKNLRDSYAKHRRQSICPSDDSSKNFINWRWAPFMTFLDPHLRKNRDIMANDHESAEENSPETRYGDMQDSEGPEVSASDLQDPSSSGFYSLTRRLDGRKRRYVDSSDGIVIEPFQQDSGERLDKTDYLFLSYAETFKKLNPRRQALLKLQMAKMFAEAELQEIDTDPIKFEREESN